MECDETEACECEHCVEHAAWKQYQRELAEDRPAKGWWDSEDSCHS